MSTHTVECIFILFFYSSKLHKLCYVMLLWFIDSMIKQFMFTYCLHVKAMTLYIFEYEECHIKRHFSLIVLGIIYWWVICWQLLVLPCTLYCKKCNLMANVIPYVFCNASPLHSLFWNVQYSMPISIWMSVLAYCLYCILDIRLRIDIAQH